MRATRPRWRLQWPLTRKPEPRMFGGDEYRQVLEVMAAATAASLADPEPPPGRRVPLARAG